MSYDRSYLVMFRLLDYYYFNVNYEENQKTMLGGMLGAMSPDNEFLGGIPDIAYYRKWTDICDRCFNSDNDYLLCVTEYLTYYIKEYDFDFLLPILDYIKSDPGINKFHEIKNSYPELKNKII